MQNNLITFLGKDPTSIVIDYLVGDKDYHKSILYHSFDKIIYFKWPNINRCYDCNNPIEYYNSRYELYKNKWIYTCQACMHLRIAGVKGRRKPIFY